MRKNKVKKPHCAPARARQLEPRPTHRSPRAALRPSIVKHDSRRRPAALSGSSVHARRQERQQQFVRPEAQRRFQINHFSIRNAFILRQPLIHPTKYKNIWSFEPDRGRLHRHGHAEENLLYSLRLLSGGVGIAIFYRYASKVFVVVSAV